MYASLGIGENPLSIAFDAQVFFPVFCETESGGVGKMALWRVPV